MGNFLREKDKNTREAKNETGSKYIFHSRWLTTDWTSDSSRMGGGVSESGVQAGNALGRNKMNQLHAEGISEP